MSAGHQRLALTVPDLYVRGVAGQERLEIVSVVGLHLPIHYVN